MSSTQLYRFPSPEGFAMQREQIVSALGSMVFPEDFRFTLVERFHGVGHLDNGLIRGFRIEIRGSEAIYHDGVGPGDTGDATIDMTATALEELIHLSGGDPAHAAAVERLLRSGDLVRTGRWDALAALSAEVHRGIVRHTA